MYKLIIEDDEGKTTVVPLIRDEISIGRKEGNTIRLTERNVSRHHARLYRQSGTVYVEDLNSHNGTKINGERLQKRTALGEGDSIQIGDYRLSVKLDRTDSKGPAQTDEPLTRPFVRPSEAAAPASTTTPAPSSAATISLPQPVSIAPVPGVPAPAPEKPARLVVISSNFAGQEFPLDKAAVVIGRTDENDVVINHRSISRHHAKIVKEGNHYHIVDLQSANGVRVNGEEYGKVELRKGDQIDLGHVRLVFVQSGQDFDIKGKIVDIEGAGRGRSWVTWVVVMLVLVAGLGVGARYLLPQIGGVGRLDPDAEAGKLLVDVDTDLHAKRWGEAIDKVDRVLQIANISQQTRENATLKRDRAQTEKRAQTTYDRFVSAAGSKSYDDALHIYKELPADSAYHAMAQDAYTTVFPLFIEQHLRLAEEARQRGACPDRDAEVQKVFDVTPGNIQAQGVKDKPCPERERVAVEVTPPQRGKRGTSRPSAQQDVNKPDSSASPGAEPPSKGSAMTEEEAGDKLGQAQTAYVNGEYTRAIELARPASKVFASRAWRIIGAAACNTRDLKLIADACKHLDEQGRQYVLYVCQRQGVERIGTTLQFKLTE